MKRATLMVSLIFTLGGCATSEDMLERKPTFSAEARFTKSEFRDCVFRWADHNTFVLQYHPDGVWIKAAGGNGPAALIVQIDGVVTLYHHWNVPFLKKRLLAGSDTARLTEALAESLCVRAALKPATFAFKLGATCEIVKCVKKARKRALLGGGLRNDQRAHEDVVA